MSVTNPDQITCIETLERFKIEPRNVAVFGVNTEGYMQYQRDTFGRVTFDGERAKVESRPWPEGFPVHEFLTSFHNWQATL